ncbi:PREDICTED: uncharacterized protein LOC106302728 [Brassica oleracea var. oleracea]|uniref:uncharacterized protein LOC106302728 n=1 Tax=Brassica oleracea var. oleracea TaxID=109376 RepID=UPI0006A74743|nr:PREDICTED: uncharacterized protein LOC106302728 [Brassica oleracea var. oleracea]
MAHGLLNGPYITPVFDWSCLSCGSADKEVVQALPSTRWRCQTDASWINDKGRPGLGFVLLDTGTPVLFRAKGIRHAASPLHAEAEGLLWAMQEILKLGNRAIRFESDCEQLVKLLEDEEDWPAMAPEIDEIKVLSAEFTESSIAYIPRSTNVRADSLAKGGRSRVFGSPFVNCFAPCWLAPYAGQEAAN